MAQQTPSSTAGPRIAYLKLPQEYPMNVVWFRMAPVLYGLGLAACAMSARARTDLHEEPLFEEVPVRDVVDVDMLFVIDNS